MFFKLQASREHAAEHDGHSGNRTHTSRPRNDSVSHRSENHRQHRSADLDNVDASAG